MGAVAIGISGDSVERQARFREKNQLNMRLLADTEKKVAEAYGVYKEKQMYGKTVRGIERTTFIIGRDGRIRAVFPKVKVDGHIEEVLKALQADSPATATG